LYAVDIGNHLCRLHGGACCQLRLVILQSEGKKWWYVKGAQRVEWLGQRLWQWTVDVLHIDSLQTTCGVSTDNIRKYSPSNILLSRANGLSYQLGCTLTGRLQLCSNIHMCIYIKEFLENTNV